MFVISAVVAAAGEVWERAKSLQEKMQANLQMAKDRLDVLGTNYIYLPSF